MIDVRITLAASLAEVTRARAWALEQVRPACLGEDDVFALELALAEALTNVVRHAYGEQVPDRDGEDIILGLCIDAGELQITVRDWGHAAPAARAPQIDLDEPRTGGYGLFLLEELMDEVRVSPADGKGTILQLHRRLGVDRP